MKSANIHSVTTLDFLSLILFAGIATLIIYGIATDCSDTATYVYCSAGFGR